MQCIFYGHTAQYVSVYTCINEAKVHAYVFLFSRLLYGFVMRCAQTEIVEKNCVACCMLSFILYSIVSEDKCVLGFNLKSLTFVSVYILVWVCLNMEVVYERRSNYHIAFYILCRINTLRMRLCINDGLFLH